MLGHRVGGRFCTFADYRGPSHNSICSHPGGRRPKWTDEVWARFAIAKEALRPSGWGLLGFSVYWSCFYIGCCWVVGLYLSELRVSEETLLMGKPCVYRSASETLAHHLPPVGLSDHSTGDSILLFLKSYLYSWCPAGWQVRSLVTIALTLKIPWLCSQIWLIKSKNLTSVLCK